MDKQKQLNKKRKGFGKPPKPTDTAGNIQAPETAPIEVEPTIKNQEKKITKKFEFVGQMTIRCKPETHKWMKLQALKEDIRIHELFERMKNQYDQKK